MCFFRNRISRRLKKIGSSVDTSFMVYVNNDAPISFPAMHDVVSYLKEYRKSNTIFKLQLFRIETYSL